MSGQDKTVLTEFQITLILYSYESLGGGVIINRVDIYYVHIPDPIIKLLDSVICIE